jgi:hypothetical protein
MRDVDADILRRRLNGIWTLSLNMNEAKIMAGTWNGRQERKGNGQFGAAIYPKDDVVFDDERAGDPFGLTTIPNAQIDVGDTGPWGIAKHVREELEGISIITGSDDNGIQLSAERNESMPEPLRREGGWYLNRLDEHILVWFAFIEECDDDDAKTISRRFRDDFPDEYERLTGKHLRKGQSRKRDQERFYLQHANDMISVWSSATYGEEMVRVTARRPSAPDEYATYEIPTQEYYDATREDKSSFGIVIDESRYKPVEKRTDAS